MNKRAAIYARVSTDEQAERGYSLQDQIESCHEYAGFNSLNVVAEIQDDCSGAKLERPGLDELRDMVDHDEVNAVIVYTDDRLSRNLVHFLILREDWQSAGCELHLVTRGKSEDTAEGRLTERIHAVIAEFEREKIRERTRRGKLAKARSGKPVMVGNPPYGYTRNGKGREAIMVRNEEQLAVVKMIFEWYTQGDGRNGLLSMREIARKLRKKGMPTPTPGIDWSNIAVHRILDNEIYAGVTYYGKTRTINKKKVKQPRDQWQEIPVPDLACIEREVFLVAQQRKQRNRELAKRNRKRKYLMSGHFRCGTCGGVMVGYYRQGYTRYQCHTMWTGQRYEPCPSSNRSIATHKVDDSVWDWIVWLLSDDDNLEAGLQYMADNRDSEIENTRRELALVEKLLSENEQLLKRLVTEMVNHDDVVLEVFRQQIEEAKNSRKKLEAEKSQLIERISQVEISQELRTQIKESAAIIRERLSEIKYKDKRYIMDILNARVVFNVDDEKRWLDVKCDLPASDASIVLCNSVKTRLPIKQI